MKPCAEMHKHFCYSVQPGRQFIFNTIEVVEEHATRRLWSYDKQRPNMAIGGITLATILAA